MRGPAVANLPRLDRVMKKTGIRGVGGALRRRIVLKDLQRLDQRSAGGDRRRRGEHPVVAVPTGQRPALDRAVLRQVVEGDEPAVLRHVVGDPPGNRPAIEGCAPSVAIVRSVAA